MRAAVLAVFSLGWTGWVAWPIYDARELAGAMEGLEKLEGSITVSEVIYFDLPGDDYATVDYLYGRPAFAYDRKQFRKEVPDLREAGLLEDAGYVTVGEADEPAFPGLRLRDLGHDEDISFLRLEDGFKSVPYTTYEERQRFRIYEIEQTS